jgi:hypothetical protein
VPADKFNALSKPEQDNLCKSEQNAVSAFLKNDSVNFRNIINERIAALGEQAQH